MLTHPVTYSYTEGWIHSQNQMNECSSPASKEERQCHHQTYNIAVCWTGRWRKPCSCVIFMMSKAFMIYSFNNDPIPTHWRNIQEGVGLGSSMQQACCMKTAWFHATKCVLLDCLTTSSHSDRHIITSVQLGKKWELNYVEWTENADIDRQETHCSRLSIKSFSCQTPYLSRRFPLSLFLQFPHFLGTDLPLWLLHLTENILLIHLFLLICIHTNYNCT